MGVLGKIGMGETSVQQVQPALGLNLGLVIVVVNESAAGFLGRRPEELLGLELSHLSAEPDLDLYRALLDLKNEAPLSERRLETVLAVRDGTKRVALTLQRLSGSDDVHYGITFAAILPQEAIVAGPPSAIESGDPIASVHPQSFTETMDNRDIAEVLRREEILGRLSRLLASADQEDEALLLVQDASLELIPDSRGMIGLFLPDSKILRSAGSWGGSWPAQFSAQDCWALKSGEVHVTGPGISKIPAIRNADQPGVTVAVPMIGRGRLLGVLVFNSPSAAAEDAQAFALGLARALQPALGRMIG